MLFSAGMGTGLLFSGVYEPLHHYVYPPSGPAENPQSFQLAFLLTYLHWGVSGWVCYVAVGLILAHFAFNRGLPFRFSSLLYPFWKEEIRGWKGQLIDVLAVLSVLAGVAATLGRGSMQINSGLQLLFQVPWSRTVQALIIAVLTFVAALSVLSGLNQGIRRLSQWNIALCFLLLVATLFFGPTVFVLNTFLETFGFYLQNLLKAMTWTESLGSKDWRSQWTILYWAWWIAWAPFVGVFIARISKGRTIREFIIGALLFPALLSCFWFAVFGGSGLYYQISGAMDLSSLLKTEYSLMTFEFFKIFPFGKILGLVALLTVAVFFITSSDSASYIVYQMTKKGDRFKVLEKIHWAFLEGALALFLLFTGGIKALELLVIVITFPFLFLIPAACLGFLKELKREQGPLKSGFLDIKKLQSDR